MHSRCVIRDPPTHGFEPQSIEIRFRKHPEAARRLRLLLVQIVEGLVANVLDIPADGKDVELDVVQTLV